MNILTVIQGLLNALKVIVLTPHIRTYLEECDPKALTQARRAILAADPSFEEPR